MPIPEYQPPPTFEKNTVLSAKDGKKVMFPMINMLDEVVLKKIKKSESENMMFFSEKVLEQISQHFPIVYRKEEKCDEKGDNTLIMMEKFDGEYSDIYDSSSIDELMSFLLQIMMALYTIDSYGKYHGDLNPGNVLFKKIDDSDEADCDHKGYLKYIIDGETYYLKHYNKLWVVIDFEYSGEKGEVLETSGKGFNPEFFKKLFSKHYDDIKEPIKGSWLYDMYVLSHFIEAHNIAERVFYMIQDGCSLNPVEAIPLIIKNDMSNIFIRESNQ
jgi:serine/threonine protein kinase